MNLSTNCKRSTYEFVHHCLFLACTCGRLQNLQQSKPKLQLARNIWLDLCTDSWLHYKTEQQTEAPAQKWSTIKRLAKGDCSVLREYYRPQRTILPPSNQNFGCLLVIDAFSRFLVVCSVTKKWFLSYNLCSPETDNYFYNPSFHFTWPRHCLDYFNSTECVNGLKELGTTLQPQAAH